ncbi:MAG: DUF373 family protein [Candidatus Aenigmatarchaeota archaeon]
MAKQEKILILCVDRDDDIGRKTSFKGPIVGKENIKKCATDLGMSDPTDSDVNALFETIRVYNEMKDKKNLELAVLTGHRNVGIESDRIISKQFDKVIDKFKADYVVLVTDGVEDENVMPIIQSKVPILSVKRVIVKQSEQLESGYYKIKDFINESLDNPKFSRLVFGLPAIILILLGLFGTEAVRIIIGLIGIYLFVKGFKLEEYVTGAVEELQSSFSRRRFAFFMYVVAIVFTVLGFFRGYDGGLGFVNLGVFEITAGFVSSSIYMFFIAGTALWIGRNVSIGKRTTGRVVAVPVFGLAISLVIFNASELIIKPQLSIFDFILSIIVGFALLIIALVIEWRS